MLTRTMVRPMVRPMVGGLVPSEGFVGLLDLFPGAAAAYSLQRLAAATTNVVRVREATGDTEQDFTAAQIADGTLESFCGSGDGFVTTCYDQSINALDATQATFSMQPKIVASGALVTRGAGGKPSMQFTNASGQFLNIAGKTSQTSSDESIFGINEIETVSNRTLLGSNNSSYFIFSNASSTNQFAAGGFSNGSQALRSTSGGTSFSATSHFRSNSLTRLAAYQNNVLLQESDVYSLLATNTMSIIGARSVAGTESIEGFISEIILYNSNEEANRLAIETEINSRYGIY